jgi:hypothetical protein
MEVTMTEKIIRDTTRDLFNAVLQLVKANGCFEKAEAILDYHLPNLSESNIREDIELSNYRFDFNATVQFGGSEGIYIDCYLSGEFTEGKRKMYNASTGTTETETRRHIGTFKTLRDDLESMMIMGELCGALVYYAHEYVNKNIDRYTPLTELIKEQRFRDCNAVRNHYISELAATMNSDEKCEVCADKECRGKEDGCLKGVEKFIINEVGKYCSTNRYEGDSRNQYFAMLDGAYNTENDSFTEYVEVLMTSHRLTIYQTIGLVFVWLYTREQDITPNQ